MSIKNKTESDERKETGKRFQELVRDAILYRFKSTFSWLSHDDITSCKMCGHGEDIKLKERFRAMIPVCIECRYREKGAGMQTIYSWFEKGSSTQSKARFYTRHHTYLSNTKGHRHSSLDNVPRRCHISVSQNCKVGVRPKRTSARNRC